MLIQPQPHRQESPPPSADSRRIAMLDDDLRQKFSGVMSVEPFLNRKLVSFQSNKTRPFYRLYRYKEAFSADLVEHLLTRYGVASPVLDCFAGAGTALFACSERGIGAEGIEILPCGSAIIEGRLALREASAAEREELAAWMNPRMWRGGASRKINALRISADAYPPETEKEIGKFAAAAEKAAGRVSKILLFALLSVLEDVSYTRKDGQFLRWDNRSGRKLKNVFNKGHVPSFAQAIAKKIQDMLDDLSDSSLIVSRPGKPSPIALRGGSCLDIMPSIADGAFGAVITSPPYCNRYDYTRTYALELALLGVGEAELSALRQAMLSCTVENREKNLDGFGGRWRHASRIADEHPLIEAIVGRLREMHRLGSLNNGGIPRMVAGYFREMACVIAECARALKPGGKMIMVNDNVRYGGIDISVDLILADIAERLGFRVVDILVLPQEKGNSSQQMGAFGRSKLRKCVYCWEKL